MEGWDSHPLRTESNMTPNQLWIYGKSMCKGDEIMVDLGIHWSKPWPSTRSGTNFNDSVNIPQHNIMLTEVQNDKPTARKQFVWY